MNYRSGARQCPVCKVELFSEVHALQITIDRCSTCQGIFLDSGELSKLTSEPLAVEKKLLQESRPRERCRICNEKTTQDLCGKPFPGACPDCGEGFKVIDTPVGTLDICGGCRGIFIQSKLLEKAIQKPSLLHIKDEFDKLEDSLRFQNALGNFMSWLLRGSSLRWLP